MSGSHFDSSMIRAGTLHLEEVPEPSAFALLGLGLLGMAASRRRKQ